MGKRRFSGTGITLVLSVIVLSLVLGMGLAWYGSQLPLVGFIFGEGRTQTSTTPVVVEGIQELDSLSSIRWTESVVVTKENEGSLGSFLTGEKVLLVATGEVEAGMNLSEIGEDDVAVSGETVTIDLPEPEILTSSLSEEETRVYDQEFGLFNLKPDDEGLAREARLEAEDRIVDAAQDRGILEDAENSAQESLRAFVLTLGFERVEFE